MKKLKCILLIDDDEATNYLHKLYIEQANIVENIRIAYNGIEALEYLKNTQNSEYLIPELIFLDINMPGMNGWEFLEEYKKLDVKIKGSAIVIMLTASINPDDEAIGISHPNVVGYITKPLLPEKIIETYNKIFVFNYK